MYALTAKAMHDMDQFTINNGIPGMVLMENAGKALLNKVTEIFPDNSTKILIVIGSGNNGGDGLCLARWLLHLEYNVTVMFLGKVENMTEDTKNQLQIFNNLFKEEKILKYIASKTELKGYDLIIDGLLGTGINREISGDYLSLIDLINKSEGKKLSIDVPSGLNATNGQIMKIAVKADYTVTFANPKIGLLIGDGPDCCGKLTVADIGLDNNGYDGIDDKVTVCDEEFLLYGLNNILQQRKKNSHKGTYGTVGIVAGDETMLGASILAAKASYRAGCGLVKIFCPREAVNIYNVSIPEAVTRTYENNDLKDAKSKLKEFINECDSLCIGPGFREDSFGVELLNVVLASNARVVIDAGALNLLSLNLLDFTFRNCKCVLTPHIGEMAKLAKETNANVSQKMFEISEKFVNEYMTSLTLKSNSTIILLRKKDGTLFRYVNTMGNNGLATAGSGDVLTGIIGSLIAQGNTLDASLLYGVLMHAKASENYDNPRKMMASDIIENI